jgi:cyclopropane fatty-acyl-phospholipid synthase-like methyltransferase
MRVDQERLVDTASRDGKPWISSSYYTAAEQNLPTFWSEESIFRRLFNGLDLGRTLELACGHGRHLRMTAALERCRTIVGIDILAENIAVCQKRFEDSPKISLSIGNGVDFRPIQDGSMDSIYCYDAMVHFDSEVVFSYLRDTLRVLRTGGMALYHHSNYTSAPGRHFGQNPHARNFMSKELFAHYAIKSGLSVKEQHVRNWGNEQNLDCVTLLRKPG